MTQTKHIAGDWMTDGYVNNYNRVRHLEVVVDGGKAYDANDSDDAPALRIDGSEIRGWGESTSFVADEGELARVGLE